MSNDQLPSINDFTEDLSELPSADEFIKEDLPSVEEFVEKEEEDIVEETIEEPVAEESGDLTEVLRLINDVRKDIPDIPEIKCYDEELKKLTEYIDQVHDCIPEVPEVKYYDKEVEAICEQIDTIKEEVKDLPEVKYYDEQIKSIEHKLDLTNQNIDELPEPKYYDQEIEAICEQIDKVKADIPTFPKWVNEVNEVPDFTWIGKTFSVIDDDFIKVNDHILDLKTRFDSDIDTLSESLDTKDFERRGEVSKVREDLKETKDRIYEELKETALKIWEHKDQFKDDDRKLKKSVLSKLNEARQKIEKQIAESYNKSYESNKTLKTYFEGLKEEIANLPEPKYYDDPIKDLKEGLSKLDERVDGKILNISELYKIVGELKETQQELKEVYNDRPIQPDPSEKQGNDPLTPTDQKFATLQDLAANYRLFVNRVEQQLYTIGGGGAGFIKDLDDVSFTGITTGSMLIYEASTQKWVGIASTALGSGSVGAAGTWTTDSVGIHTTKSVGIGTTASSSYALIVGGDIHATGNVSVAGTITYDDVKHVDSTGISTFRAGIIVDTVGVSVSAGIVTTPSLHVGAGIITASDSGINVTGVITATSFDGSVAFASTSTVPGISTQGHSVFNTINASGIVTANSFSGDGSALTNLPGQKDLWSINATGIHTLSNVGVGTTSATHTLTVGAVGASGTSLFVHGDARIVGILSVGQGTITLDPNAKTLTGLDELKIGSGTTAITIKKSVTTGEIEFADQEGQESSIGIGTTVSINTTGIVTATQFISNSTTTAFYPPVLTTTQRDAMSGLSQGAMIFNSTSKKMEFYDGTTWQSLPGMSLGLTVALDG